MNKLINELEKAYNHTNQWLKFAESKNGALIALDSALIIGILSLFRSFTSIEILYYYFFWVISFLIISMVISSLSFIPILSKKNQDEVSSKEIVQKKNILFFSEIKHLTPDEYLNILIKKIDFKGSEITDYAIDYADQIINNSKIADNKYKLFKWALYFFVTGILPPMGLVFLGFWAYYDKSKGDKDE